MTPEPMLFAEDIARLRNISRWQARRWLELLEAEYGTTVVGHVKGRRGVRRYTSEGALARIGPRGCAAEARLLSLVNGLARRIRALEERVAVLGFDRAHRSAQGALGARG